MLGSEDVSKVEGSGFKPLAECCLYGFVDLAYLRGRSPVAVAEELCRGGVDILQLRAKGLQVGEVQKLAAELAPVVASAGVWFVVNDHVEVALEVGAPLCHLGQEDFFGAGHRHAEALIPPGSGLQLGLSSHAPDQALRAVQAGAAYLGIGPVYPTPTKPGRPGVGLDYVRWAAANLTIPWFAIGGITRANVEEVKAAGARRVCVVSDLLNAPDLGAACQSLKQRLGSAHSKPVEQLS